MPTSDSPEQILEPGYKLATRALGIIDKDSNFISQLPTDSPSYLSVPILAFKPFGQLEWAPYHTHKTPYEGKANIVGTPTDDDYNYILDVFRYHNMIAESTDSPPPIITPDDNTPPGHWVNLNVNSNTADLIRCAAYPNVKGVWKRFMWSELEPGITPNDQNFNPFYNLLEVLANSSDAKTRETKLGIFIEDKVFNNKNPMPLDMISAGLSYQYKGAGGATNEYMMAKRWHTTVLSREAEFWEAFAARSDIVNHPNFGGINIPESAMGVPWVTAWANGEEVEAGWFRHRGGKTYECRVGGTTTIAPTGTNTNINGGGGTRWDWVKNSTSIGVQDIGYNTAQFVNDMINIKLPNTINAVPDHHVFWFGNFLTGDGATSTNDANEQIYNIAAVMFAEYGDQFVLAGPDLFMGSSSLIDWNRAYGHIRRHHATPNARFGESIQNDSYAHEWDSTSGADKGSYGKTVENIDDNYNDLDQIFLYGQENLNIEWCFWNDHNPNWGNEFVLDDSIGNSSNSMDGLDVIAKYPTWEVATNLLGAEAEKDLSYSSWTAINGAESISTYNNPDYEETRGTAGDDLQGSWYIHEGTTGTNSVRGYQATIPASSFEDGEQYIFQIVVKASGRSDFRLQTIQTGLSSGGYKGMKFNLATGSWRNTPHEWERYWDLGDGWYHIQVALTWSTGDGDVKYQINPCNTSGSQNVDGQSNALIIGRRRVFKRLRQ